MSHPVWVVSDEGTWAGHEWGTVAGIFPIDRQEEAVEFVRAKTGRQLHPGSLDNGVSFHAEVTVSCEQVSKDTGSLPAGSAE